MHGFGCKRLVDAIEQQWRVCQVHGITTTRHGGIRSRVRRMVSAVAVPDM